MKNVFLLLCFSFGLTAIHAQIELGIKAQYGKAWLDYDLENSVGIVDYEQRIPNYAVSAEVLYQLPASRFAVGVAPGYARRGAGCEPGFAGGGFLGFNDATIYGNYLQLPILARFTTVQNGRWTSSVQLGGGPAYFLSGYREISFFGDIPSEQQQLVFENEENLNRVDVAAQGSLQIQYQLGPGSVKLSGDYHHGFIDMNERFQSRHRAWSVGLGYALRL